MNAGNDGFDKEGDPIRRVKTRAQGEEDGFTYSEQKSGCGQTAQRVNAINSGSVNGNQLITQNDLQGKVANWNQTCFLLTLMAAPQALKGEYLTKNATIGLINKYQGKLLGTDMKVLDPNGIVNDVARMIGFSSGRVGDYSETVPADDPSATVRVRADRNHYNLGRSSGGFLWEVWDGGADSIPTPIEYRGLYFK
jgi:hypothetical protein